MCVIMPTKLLYAQKVIYPVESDRFMFKFELSYFHVWESFSSYL